MSQDFINVILGSFGALLGFLGKSLWDAVKDLQTADKALADKVNAIEVLVAGKYVTRDELTHLFDGMVKQLDRIESKLESKADK